MDAGGRAEDCAGEDMIDVHERFLRKSGWWPSDDGWRHRSLFWPWPKYDAVQLTREAMDGKQDEAGGCVYADLRKS